MPPSVPRRTLTQVTGPRRAADARVHLHAGGRMRSSRRSAACSVPSPSFRKQASPAAHRRACIRLSRVKTACLTSRPEICDLLSEERRLPPLARTCAPAPMSATSRSTSGPRATPRRSGRRSPRSSSGRAVDTVLDWQPPVRASGSSAAQLNASVNCVDRHVRRAAPQQGGDHLGRRAGRSPHADLLRPVPRGLPVRQRAEVARRRARATAWRSTCR